ncbi:condensin-2 complex subunit D3 [Trichonephila clavipes]|nr:condensin-2 complex subunit D3 [Trichonephila clavipes]
MVDDLLRLTSEYFDSVNFSELDEAWIDEVIENEFTDVEECKTDTNVLFAGDPLDILKNICLVCDGWTFKPVEDDFDESDAGNISARPDKVLWTYLDSMDITVKQICVLIYCLCSKAMKINSSHEDKKIGLLSAKWYFGILRVPGSSAYSVFNSNLFRLCVDCFQVADLIDCKDALFKWRDFESLFPTMISALQSLVPLMNTCHFGTDSSTTDHVIHKLSELVVSEISNPKLNFDLNFLVLSEKEFRRKYSWSYVLTCLAYQGLTSLINSDLNGEKEHNFETVLSVMNNHILCVKTKKAPIPVKFVTIKENAVSFICHHLEENKEFSSKLTQTTLKRLCFSVIDRADFRQTVAKSILAIMLHLKVEDIAEFIQWLLLLVDAHDMNNRVFGIEILGFLIETLSKIDKEGLPESLEVYLSPIPIIFAILTRCDDNSPSVRSKALSVLAQNMKGILEILVIQEPSLYLKENFSEDVNNFDQNGEHRLFWYNFSSFEEIADEIMSILHRRMDDNNGTARKSALHALENIMSFKSSFLLDENLKLFLSAAKDPNIAMRKQTVQSLTGILNIYPNDIKAQESWLKCIMPLIQDPENSVQTKVLDVIEGKFLQTILSDKKHERDGVFQLLEKLTRGKFLSHQRYLQKAFCFWQKEKKLRYDEEFVKDVLSVIVEEHTATEKQKAVKLEKK